MFIEWTEIAEPWGASPRGLVQHFYPPVAPSAISPRLDCLQALGIKRYSLGGEAMIYTEADFDRLSWHDCHIWGIELRAGDADDGDWTSDLVLDSIMEWICGTGGGGQFRVAPATLVFHGVTDPRSTSTGGVWVLRSPCIRRRSAMLSENHSGIRRCTSTALITGGGSA